MKQAIHQEILLITGTSFSGRQCWQKNSKDEGFLSEADQLQEACCNGLLPEMLPELYRIEGAQKLFLWQISENKSSIGIALGEYPITMDRYFSIDPYLFVSTQMPN